MKESLSDFLVRYYHTEIIEGTSRNPERITIGGIIIALMIPVLNICCFIAIFVMYFTKRKKR